MRFSLSRRFLFPSHEGKNGLLASHPVRFFVTNCCPWFVCQTLLSTPGRSGGDRAAPAWGVLTMLTPANADGRAVGPNPQSAVNAELLSVVLVAELCGCSTRTVRRLADSGRIPRPIKLGALLRWRRAEVLDWISAGCPAVQPQKGRAQ